MSEPPQRRGVTKAGSAHTQNTRQKATYHGFRRTLTFSSLPHPTNECGLSSTSWNSVEMQAKSSLRTWYVLRPARPHTSGAPVTRKSETKNTNTPNPGFDELTDCRAIHLARDVSLSTISLQLFSPSSSRKFKQEKSIPRDAQKKTSVVPSVSTFLLS